MMYYSTAINENMGGWGAITMGLLSPVGLGGKSFGVLGMGVKTTSPAYDPTA